MTSSNYILLFVLLAFHVSYNTVKTNEILRHLGTRTPYRFMFNKDDSKIVFPNCKDTKIWMVVRHGTRLPSAKDIIGSNSYLKELKYQILLQHNLKKVHLNEEQLKRFKEWDSSLNIANEKFLTEEGEDEMILLARRMHKRFPNAISNNYNNESFLFRYTATQRAQSSAKHFTIGLFEKKESQNVVYAQATKIDPLLRFYKYCDRWLKQVKKNPYTYVEQHKFGLSREMNETLKKISNKLGLNEILPLEIVNLMYKTCGYETSWTKNEMSPWCYAFDLESIQMLEYYHDLRHYWMDGYGHDLTHKQACLAIKNMFETFSQNEKPNATFLFAHSGTLLKILSHLQLFKPSAHLMGDKIQKDRSWKASNIDCFASNLAFVLYKCNDGNHVLTLHQERIIKLPMCEQELCPLKHLTDYFYDTIHKCDYTDMCSLNRNDEL